MGLDLEHEGSSRGSFLEFKKIFKTLGLESIVEARKQTLQQIENVPRFDVVIMNNVVNHFDEDAIQKLSADNEAQQIYQKFAKRIRSQMNINGILNHADCAKKLFFGNLNLKSPFAPTIEWHKHQNQDVWINIFSSVGFKVLDDRWSPMYPLGRISQNKFIQHFSISHFVLRMIAE